MSDAHDTIEQRLSESGERLKAANRKVAEAHCEQIKAEREYQRVWNEILKGWMESAPRETTQA